MVKSMALFWKINQNDFTKRLQICIRVIDTERNWNEIL